MNADLCNIQNKLVKKYNFQVAIVFTGHGSDVYSDILSHKLAPSTVLFSYWKKTDQIASCCARSLFYLANIIVMPTNMMRELTGSYMIFVR
jgi:hypothetical protein